MKNSHFTLQPSHFILSLAFILYTFFLSDALAATSHDPALKWSTIRSEHFEVHYSQGLEGVARLAGAIAEDVHKKLSPKLGWTPRTRTHLIVTDNSDFANGATSVFPYPNILIYVAAPSSGESLDHYDVWLHTLISHEYTHVLMMDMTGGIPGLLRHVFGRSLAMNAIVPKWWSEGVATFEETVNTIQGRGRSTYADMVLRAAILEDRFPRMAELEGGLIRWPSGDGPYIIGVEFVSYLANRFGEEKINRFLAQYGRQIIPFRMNGTARRIFGSGMTQLWKDWQDSLKEKYLEQREAILAAGLIEGKAVTRLGFGVLYPVWDPEGRQILFFDYSPQEAPAVYAVNPDTGKLTRIFKTLALGPISISPNGRTVAYPHLIPFSAKPSARFYQYTDIYIQEIKQHKTEKNYESGIMNYEIRDFASSFFIHNSAFIIHNYIEPVEYFEGHETQLTHEERATDPDFSPDGEEIVYVARKPGRTELKRIGISTGTHHRKYRRNRPEVIWDPGPDVMLDTPRWAPDGTRIAVSVHTNGGYRDIYLLDLARDNGGLACAGAGAGACHAPLLITHDRARDVDPAWSPDSRYILFSSDRTGVSNLFAYDTVNGSFAMVTNVIAGAFQPAVSPDQKQIVYQGYTSKGFDLFVMPFDPAKWKSVTITPEQPATNEYHRPSPLAGETRRYRPFSTLLPRFIEPNFWYDGVDFQAGLSTGGMDPLIQHIWGGAARWGISSNFLSWGATYINNQLKPAIIASFQQYSVSFGKILLCAADMNNNHLLEIPDELFYLDKNYFEVRSQGSIGVENLLFADGIPLRVNLSYNLEERSNITSLPHLVFDSLLPDRGVFSGFEASVTSRSLEDFPYSISPELGYYARGGIEWLDKALGSDFSQIIYTADLRGFVPIPWLAHHVLALRAAGGWMEGDKLFQGTFRVGGTLGESVISSPGNKFFALRGFRTNQFIGDRALVLSGEYRFPIAYPQRSIGLTPVYFQKIHAALFADYGGAFDRKNRFPLTFGGVPLRDVNTGRPIFVEFENADQWNLGVGAEIRITGFLGWGLIGPAITGRLGVAQDVQGNGIGPVFYFDIGTPF